MVKGWLVDPQAKLEDGDILHIPKFTGENYRGFSFDHKEETWVRVVDASSYGSTTVIQHMPIEEVNHILLFGDEI
jgi:16S rRNA C1402 N4-methylase RsmH